MNTTDIITTTDLSRVTLGKFKHYARLSEETVAFTADILLDGKKVGTADNRGHGGCTNVRIDTGHPLTVVDLEAHVDSLVEAELDKAHNAKFILRMRKKARETSAYITTDCEKGSYKAFKKGTMVNLTAVQSKPGFLKFVVDMTDAEILAHFTANA